MRVEGVWVEPEDEQWDVIGPFEKREVEMKMKEAAVEVVWGPLYRSGLRRDD